MVDIKQLIYTGNKKQMLLGFTLNEGLGKDRNLVLSSFYRKYVLGKYPVFEDKAIKIARKIIIHFLKRYYGYIKDVLLSLMNVIKENEPSFMLKYMWFKRGLSGQLVHVYIFELHKKINECKCSCIENYE